MSPAAKVFAGINCEYINVNAVELLTTALSVLFTILYNWGVDDAVKAKEALVANDAVPNKDPVTPPPPDVFNEPVIVILPDTSSVPFIVELLCAIRPLRAINSFAMFI
jgi:hypothetical protein